MAVQGVIIRAYGILIDHGQLLVSDEYRLGMAMTKFPGGGLEPGEGLKACLQREWREELGVSLTSIEHYYTTDFFQPTIGLPDVWQLIAVYYRVQVAHAGQLCVSQQPFDFPLTNGQQAFRWIPLNQLSVDDFTLPIDKVVAQRILSSP